MGKKRQQSKAKGEGEDECACCVRRHRGPYRVSRRWPGIWGHSYQSSKMIIRGTPSQILVTSY